MGIEQILLSVGLPALACSILLLAAAAPWQSEGHRKRQQYQWLVGWAVAAGFVSGYLAILGWPPFPAVAATDWLPYLAVLAAVAGVFESLWAGSTRGRLIMRLVVSLLVIGLLTRPLATHTWTWVQTLLWIGSLGVATATIWTLLDRSAATATGPQLPLSLLVLVAVGAGTLVMSGSASLGQLAGALAVGLGVLMVAAWRYPQRLAMRSMVPVVVVVAVALWLIGFFFADMPAGSLALLMLAPVALLLGNIPALRQRSAALVAASQVAAVALTACLGAGIAAVSYFGDSADSYAPGSPDGQYEDSDEGDDDDYGYGYDDDA